MSSASELWTQRLLKLSGETSPYGNTIDCPTCRNPAAVPTGVEGLLKNFALLDIVNDTPKENVGSNTGSHDCEACG